MLQHGDQLTNENLAWLTAQLQAKGLTRRYGQTLSLTASMVKRGIKLYCTPGTATAIALNAVFVAGVDCDVEGASADA